MCLDVSVNCSLLIEEMSLTARSCHQHSWNSHNLGGKFTNLTEWVLSSYKCWPGFQIHPTARWWVAEQQVFPTLLDWAADWDENPVCSEPTSLGDILLQGWSPSLYWSIGLEGKWKRSICFLGGKAKSMRKKCHFSSFFSIASIVWVYGVMTIKWDGEKSERLPRLYHHTELLWLWNNKCTCCVSCCYFSSLE